MTTAAKTSTEREHGTYAKYKLDFCRCYRCSFACSEYNRNRERAILYGTWQPYVDAEPVRDHVRVLLEFGMGWKQAAAVAGLAQTVVARLMYGQPKRGVAPSRGVRSKTASALLAVEPTLQNLAPSACIDGTGTRRRLQALVVAGWPQSRIGERMALTPGNFGRVIRAPRVTVRMALAVMAVYDELWQADPRAHGVDNQGYNRARNHGAARKWAPVGAWDDDTIDDPAAEPDRGENVSQTTALAENALWLVEQHGYTRQTAADRLGVSKAALEKAISRTSQSAQDQSSEPRLAWAPPKCGEARMYRKHIRDGETPCEKCKGANAAADRRYRLTGSRTEAA
ncbi:hypothetical protein OG571_47650 (plasmid) [Streptomyces sp. NBC_01369]|uniref:hypothetical protein n=1 Tax=Streptomyces sp. NBC_01369 TaxID=2903842 RepID=UPI002F90AE0E